MKGKACTQNIHRNDLHDFSNDYLPDWNRYNFVCLNLSLVCRRCFKNRANCYDEHSDVCEINKCKHILDIFLETLLQHRSRITWLTNVENSKNSGLHTSNVLWNWYFMQGNSQSHVSYFLAKILSDEARIYTSRVSVSNRSACKIMHLFRKVVFQF